MKYPEIDDENFYKKINNIYKNFTIPNKKISYNNTCIPKTYQLQMPQQFLSKFIDNKTPYRGVLIYHRIGSGKTCTSIRIAEKWKYIKKIIIVLPASLKGNFRNELRTLCAENNYLKPEERQKLAKLHPSDDKYKSIIHKSDERIDKYYKIYSYNKFVDMTQQNKIKLNNTLLIIDEIQNMISENGIYYNSLYTLIQNSPKDLRIVLLSATPMFNKPNEIGLIMNLLRPSIEFPIGKSFDDYFIDIKKKNNSIKYSIKHLDEFKNMIKGYISYFRGAPSYVFPHMYIKYVKCDMSDFQYSSYKAILKNEAHNSDIKKLKKNIEKDLNMSHLPNNFFIGTRYASNIVFPNKKVGEFGFKSLTYKKIQENLQLYSTKFDTIINKINKSTGKIFVYSSFKEYAGLKSFTKILEANGYKNYAKYNEGHKRFAIWSGDENIKYKEEIKAVFNMKENLYGFKLKMILGSSSVKEGVSFTGVRQVHILDPYWNWPRLSQVIGRANRFCSHKDLPEDKRNVKVYIYLATYPSESLTIDEYIHKLSLHKNILISKFENVIKKTALDCTLNKYANIDEENQYDCQL